MTQIEVIQCFEENLNECLNEFLDDRRNQHFDVKIDLISQVVLSFDKELDQSYISTTIVYRMVDYR